MFDENHFTQNAVNSNRKEDTADLAQSEENPVFAADTELYRIMERKYDDLIEIPRKHHVHTLKSNEVLFEILSPDGRIKYISEVCERVIGCKTEERIGRIVFDFYEGIELKKLKELFDTVLITGDMEVNDVVVLKDEEGRKTYLEISMRNMLQKPAIRGILIKVRNVTEYFNTIEWLKYISTHDELTGLPNKLSFTNTLRTLCRQTDKIRGRFAVIMLEVEGMKYVNDALGYHIGNQLIVLISERIRQNINESDFLCRYSGDRFAILVQNLDTIMEFDRYAGKVAKLFDDNFAVENYNLKVNVSIGISLYGNDDQEAETLICHAESALFRNKNENRMFRFYSPDISTLNYKQFQLNNEICKAIDADQLKVFYQPVVNLATNDLIAAEAMLRWEHPEWGTLMPEEFIPLAEKTGFIRNIETWLLREVCRNYRQWTDDGLPAIKMAVSISGFRFFESGFAESVKNIIEEFRLDPSFLIIEITEDIFLNDADKVISDIERLQSYGVRTALGDLGRDFYLLAYLDSINIDIIKFDSSYIRNIDDDQTSTVISRHIVNMAKDLKTSLVAVNIENWEQLSYLREVKCYAGQGHIYSCPVPSNDFRKILARRKCRPIIVNNLAVKPRTERRRYFRLKFRNLLEAEMTVSLVKGKKVNAGNTKVLIKDIGPGGLCLITDLRLPVESDLLLQFSADLIGTALKLYGYPVRSCERKDGLYEYGIEFTIDENERSDLVGILNQVQIKMRNNIMFAEGSFVMVSPRIYFGENK